LLIIPKKSNASGEKKYRIVVDFRKVNDATLGDAYALPNITDILDQLGRSRYFTVLDLASGFYQIPWILKTRKKLPSAHLLDITSIDGYPWV
jgi:hypothetical protein